MKKSKRSSPGRIGKIHRNHWSLLCRQRDSGNGLSVEHLAGVQEKVSDKLLMIPRIYTNKPRTNGAGYKGMVHQPDPEKAPDMAAGLRSVRKLHIDALEAFHMPAADEMLYPGNWPYMEDILSYVAVGARSVENQQHRLTVSGFDIPAGMKNPTGGDLTVMMNSIVAGQSSHNFIANGYEVNTDGNPLTHAILRGSVNKHGNNVPNYHYEIWQELLTCMKNSALRTRPSLWMPTTPTQENSGISSQGLSRKSSTAEAFSPRSILSSKAS